MIVKAAQTGNKKLAPQALLNDPLITNISTVEDLLDEMLKANKQYLPKI
jgi:alpha-galactosidase/6-phospho-beta-glucosidase family protein